MSSRIELNLSPSVAVGILATLPWLVLLIFIVIAAATGKGWLAAGIPITLIGAFAQYRNSGMLRGASSVGALRLKDEQLYAKLVDGRLIPVTAGPNSRVGARLALLKLRPVGTRLLSYSAILLADTAGTHGNVPEDEFRRLRVWLRLGRSQPTST
ncbi:hypothetical protein KFJ24_01675 [Marinobacter sediminum]|uniref:hypothetical protein n=1 Tax=Marinobacter sediminum TaxID=256323 RepID=UPI00202FAE40|nr:hypothetical protein [Marinobacter sediminum]